MRGFFAASRAFASVDGEAEGALEELGVRDALERPGVVDHQLAEGSVRLQSVGARRRSPHVADDGLR
jgi:hypothetical protein